MPPKKIVGGAKGGRPIGAKATKDGVEAEELHPELQSNWMELKRMVYDDEKLDIVMIYMPLKQKSRRCGKIMMILWKVKYF